jgi:hypothetical protein
MANTANSFGLTTDFNVEPYYDDYDSTKGYYRLLYKPGLAVQARELTQSQTILQNQVDRFGKHVFREGSIVLPGQFSIETDVDYVKIKDIDSSNVDISVSSFSNATITGTTNDITAFVIDVADGSETELNTKTLFVRYQSGSSSNTEVKTFVNNEVLSSNVGTPVLLSSDAVGKGSRFLIREGVVFAKGHFISFPTQSVILDRYGTNPTCRVGFDVIEEIVRFTEDSSLLDPALESSNYSAPGADRLKLTCLLRVRNITDQTGAPDFVELFTIQDGIVTELYERPQYNILKDELAKRTFDESGDYYVNGLSVRVRENLDTGVNGGYSNTGNSSLLSVGVEPGTAYVKGYEIGKLVTEYLTTSKSETFANINSQISTIALGNYVKVNEFTGYIDHDKGNIIQLYDTPNRRLSEKKWAATSPTGNVIGTARVVSVEYDSGTLGTLSGNVNVHLTDISMNGSNSFSSVRSIYATNFGGDIVLGITNNAIILESALNTLLYPVGAFGVKTIRDTSGNPDMSFNFKRSSNIPINSGGTFDLATTTDENFPYGTIGNILSSDKRDIILTVLEDANIALTGTVSATGGSNTLSGSGTSFTRFNVGDKIEIDGKSNTFFIATISSDISLTITEAFPSGITGNTYYKAYKNGDIIDLTSNGIDSGAARTVSASPTQLSFDLKETFPEEISASVTYQLNRSSAREVAKNLRDNRFVVIDCSTAGTTGPFNLGFSDLYQVRKIVKKNGSVPSSLTDGTDVTGSFIIDNGQKDSFYDLATITPRTTLSSGDFLLVSLDYFEPSFTLGRGYFSIDSYPIDDNTTSNTTIRTENIPIFVSPTNQLSYDLRNYIDFRPVKARTANDATTIGGASTNPSTSTNFLYETNGLRLPVPSSQYTYDYSYYLSRKDLVVIDREGTLSIINGIPSSLPITPIAPDNVMPLASIFVAPYPSLAPNYAQILNRKDLSCNVKKMSNIRYTMRDIGVLKNRIVNLEYYASISLLEKSAFDLQILDENGLNRFKNGIFVDTFKNHDLGDTTSRDYRIIVDPKEQSIRPVFTSTSLYYDYLSGSNVTKTGNLITLPYTNVVMIDQPAVTSFRNVELSSYRFLGNVYMDPDTDVWVDTELLPDNQITIGPTSNNLPQSSVSWNDWQTTVVGYVIDPIQSGLSAQGPIPQGGTVTSLSTIGLKENQLIANPNSPRDQRVSVISDTTRTGTEYSYTLEEDVQRQGEKLIDVSLVPYIRPQTVKVNGRGLKANTRLFVFFDDESMSDYVTPITEAQYDAWPRTAPSASEGANLVSNADGEVYFLLRLPLEKRFRVGTKEVVITDSLTNSIDASTSAVGYFVAQGLIQQKQDTVLTTRKVIEKQKAVSEVGPRQTKVLGYIDNPSCSAYSFIPKAPEGEEGIFMTAVDIFLQAKHPTLGIWVEIRQMDNAGGITRNQVPFSEVWIPSSDLVVSDDASVPQNIVFPAPVFLYNNVQYAFVIHTIGLNPDTYIWISRLGETDINTGTKVNSRPLTGTFYTTNNNLNWDIVPDVDLKITFYRASFQTNVTGQAILGNKPTERLLLSNVSSTLTNYGELFIGNQRLTLSGNTGSIAVTDVLIGANSGANSAVSNVSGSIFTVANNSYIQGERVGIFYGSNLVSKGITSLITNSVSASGVISKYKVDSVGNKLEVISSNGNFYVGDTIRGTVSGTTATVDAIDNIRYSLVDFEPSYLKFNKTAVAFDMATTSNTGILGSYESISENNNYFYDNEKAVLSRTNEVALISGDRSNKVRVNMLSTSEYVSPVLDTGRTHTIYVDNIINSNTTNENVATGGALTNKYISSPVTLDEGQDAEDLLVIITAYRPPNSDVKVWVRILHGEDSDVFASRGWIELEKLDENRFSSLADKNNFREFSFRFPESSLTGPNSEVQYTNSQGITFTGYKYFAVKVGLVGSNSAVVPRVADLRAIALQK